MKTRPVTPIRTFVLVVASVFMLSLGVTGALASPNDDQYGNVQAKVAHAASAPKTKPAPLTTTKSSGTLPFTGLDLTVVSVGAALLLAGGFGVRKLGRKSTDQS
jgi:hypothetical protein